MSKTDIAKSIVEVFAVLDKRFAHERPFNVPETETAERLVEQLVKLEAERIADYIVQNEIQETSYWDTPDYYASMVEFRGQEIYRDSEFQEFAVDLSGICGSFDFEYNLKTRYGINNALVDAEFCAEHDITVLCELREEGQGFQARTWLDVSNDLIYVGSAALLSEEDWAKVRDVEFDEYSNLVISEVENWIFNTVLNIMNDIDEELEGWADKYFDEFFVEGTQGFFEEAAQETARLLDKLLPEIEPSVTAVVEVFDAAVERAQVWVELAAE